MTGLASARLRLIGHEAFERRLQLGLDLRIGRATGQRHELEHDFLLLGLVGDEPFGAHAGADFGDVAPAIEADLVQPVVALEQDDRLVDGGGENELLGGRKVLGLLAEHDLARHLDAVQRLAAGALRQPDVVGGPLLQQRIVAAARQLAIDDRRQPPLAELALELRKRRPRPRLGGVW